jgi:hypothetical protein
MNDVVKQAGRHLAKGGGLIMPARRHQLSVAVRIEVLDAGVCRGKPRLVLLVG